ncbi:DUF4097 family beta strand repeat-containing protein [Actinocorallia aurea]
MQFATPAAISAVLDVPAGRVHVIAADQADTTVEVSPANPSRDRDVKAAERTTVEYADGTLRIETPVHHEILGPSGAVAVTVRMPAGSRVEAKAAIAEFRSVGALDDVAVESSYGPIAIDEAATVRLAALDGDVEVGRLGGPAEISTQRGGIRIAQAAAGTVTLTAQSGDITVGAAPGVSATLDAGTGHGRVTNALKNDGTAGLDIRATTAHGHITARSL